jgi:hypothetical protein
LDLVFPTTFYPGVVDSASALQIALNEGEGFTADFTLTEIPALRVRINHLNHDPAQPWGASLMFLLSLTSYSAGGDAANSLYRPYSVQRLLLLR